MTTTTFDAAGRTTPAAAASTVDQREIRGWSDVAAGARAMLPMLVGIVPLGLAVGVALGTSGTPAVPSLASSPLVYAGSAQLALVSLLDHQASLAVLLGVVALVNLRLGLYAVALAPHWRALPRAWRLVYAYLLVDPSFYVGLRGYESARSTRAGHRHFLGGALLLWVAWMAATTTGATVGSRVPTGLHLEAVAPLFLLAVVVDRLRDRQLRLPVLATALVAVAGTRLPLHLGLPVAMLIGLVVADVARRLRRTGGAR
jgi:branched chain amino acid efflux pump